MQTFHEGASNSLASELTNANKGPLPLGKYTVLQIPYMCSWDENLRVLPWDVGTYESLPKVDSIPDYTSPSALDNSWESLGRGRY